MCSNFKLCMWPAVRQDGGQVGSVKDQDQQRLTPPVEVMKIPIQRRARLFLNVRTALHLVESIAGIPVTQHIMISIQIRSEWSRFKIVRGSGQATHTGQDTQIQERNTHKARARLACKVMRVRQA